MNANKTMTAVSTIAVAVTALTAAMPAAAGDHRDRDFRRGERVVVNRHAPPQRVVVQRPVYQHRPQVIVKQPVIVQRQVVERRVVVQRPAPRYYREPVHAYAHQPAYYDQRAAYHDDDSNPAGAVAGAVIGGVIGSQVGDHQTRGVTTVIGAVLGGLIGNSFR
jgi:uncharacterized protein YcfJ